MVTTKKMVKRTGTDKVLRDKAIKIAMNSKYDDYERGLASMVYNLFDNKSVDSGIKSMSNQQLSDTLHKPTIRKFKRRIVNFSFKENICGADLAVMLLISKYNKIIKFLLSVVDFFSKYTWFVPLKDKTGITMVNAFQNILNDLERKPNKILVDRGS